MFCMLLRCSRISATSSCLRLSRTTKRTAQPLNAAITTLRPTPLLSTYSREQVKEIQIEWRRVSGFSPFRIMARGLAAPVKTVKQEIVGKVSASSKRAQQLHGRLSRCYCDALRAVASVFHHTMAGQTWQLSPTVSKQAPRDESSP